MRHINIVKFVNFFEDSSFAYIVMELCNNNVSSFYCSIDVNLLFDL